MINPFATKRPKAKRKEPRRVGPDRVRLYGEDKTELRQQVYGRSRGWCENCGCRAAWKEGELAHNEHGSRKSDEPDRCRWLCSACHRNEHNAGGKPVPRKAGRRMNLTEAKAYWLSEICHCTGPKKSQESFCPTCTMKLNPQTRHGLEHSDDPDDYREWLATAELEILGK